MPVSKESREQLGRALTEAREEAGFTVVQLAQIASPGRAGGLSRYYDAEAGRRMATSETVSHYVIALGRPDLQDLRNKILSKRPTVATEVEPIPVPARTLVPPREATDDPVPAPAAAAERTHQINRHAAPAELLPRPELLPESLAMSLRTLTAEVGPLDNGTVVRGRAQILGAACALMEEAIAMCTDEERSVSIQVIQLNPERSFTRNLGMSLEQSSRLFPYQIQRLVSAGGSVRHLLSHEIMHTLDMWLAFERFIGLMEQAGDYSVYWPSNHQSRARMPDYLIIENVAALEIFPTGALTWAGDAAVVHRNTSEVLSVIKEYGENLIAEADEAFQVTDPSSSYAVEQARVWVEQAILEAEQINAPRFLFKYGLSSLTEPLKSYEKRLLATHGLAREDRAAWPAWVKQDLELRRRRLANFLRQTETYRSVDAVPMSALRYYVDHGQYSEHCNEFPNYVVPVEDRIQHLEDVITMISTNVRYDLIIIEDDPPLTALAGAGILMMGEPDGDDEDWKIFYQSAKPDRNGDPISVAFETQLDMFRQRVGGRIALLRDEADKGATQSTLRRLHAFIAELRERTDSTVGADGS